VARSGVRAALSGGAATTEIEMRLPLRFMAMVFLPVLGACGGDAVLCAPLPPWAVAVDVRDSVTDLSLVSEATGAVLLAGTVEDSLRPDRLLHLSSASLLVGGNTVGLVEVRVEHPDYQPWSATNVETRLSRGECSAWETQTLTARLQRPNK
jgi:hypothetical protein